MLAVPASRRRRLRRARQRSTSFSSSRRRSPTYDGGVAGYAATKPGKGKKLDALGAAQSYAGYLKRSTTSALETVGGGDKVYDYTAVFNGFAAKLTDEPGGRSSSCEGRARRREGRELSVDARPTTVSSPAFLGLCDNGGLWDQLGGVSKGGESGAGEDVVIGDVDGGYWPENPAFSDRKVDGSNGNIYPHKVHRLLGHLPGGRGVPGEHLQQQGDRRPVLRRGHGRRLEHPGLRVPLAA